MESRFQNCSALLNQHLKHALVKKVANFFQRTLAAPIPTTSYWHNIKPDQGRRCYTLRQLRSVQTKRSLWPPGQRGPFAALLITATSCRVAQCVRRASAPNPSASWEPRKKHLQKVQELLLDSEKDHFCNSQGPRCLDLWPSFSFLLDASNKPKECCSEQK